MVLPVLPVERFLPDCVPDNLDALAVFPALPPAAVPVDRFMSAVAPARALAEFSLDPDPVRFAPATREEFAVPAVRFAREAGSTLPNLPFAFLK
jgi:hypothetical protein